MLLSLLPLIGCDRGPSVELVKPRRGRIEDSFREPAQTRLAHEYPVTMPVTGRIGRVILEPGDAVKKGQLLVDFDRVPLQKTVEELEARLAELRAGPRSSEIAAGEALVAAAQSRLAELEAGPREDERVAARSSVDRARAQLAYERSELQRRERLRRSGAVTETELANHRTTVSIAASRLVEAEARLRLVEAGPRSETVEAAKAELANLQQRLALLKSGARDEVLRQIQARLDLARHEWKLSEIRSPIDGIVLERFEQGDGYFGAGTKLLQLGRMSDLEVEAEVLSRDAQALKVGAEVRFDLGAGEERQGKIRRIEPAGFTKRSSLGIEQQRVRVLVSFDKIPASLGVHFRLHARFVTAAKDGAAILGLAGQRRRLLCLHSRG